MRAFRDHLRDKLQDKGFKDLFEEEKELVRIGIVVADARAKLGISQGDLARRAHVTQQQVSKIENGASYRVLSLLRVCRALRLRWSLQAST